MDEYHDSIGGVPKAPPSSKMKATGKRAASTAVGSAATKRQRHSGATSNGTSQKRDLPDGTWESDVTHVTNIMEEDLADGKSGVAKVTLSGHITWKNGDKTKHALAVLRQKCPQALLDYYEKHL